MSGLELASLHKSFGTTAVLRGVDLAIRDGEFLAVVGPSGCGKSTLLRILAGLESQDSGEVRLDGAVIDGLPPKARDVAMVFQSYALYPHMTVRQNLALPLVMRRLSRVERLPFAGRLSPTVAGKRRDIAEAVDRAAATVALTALLDRKPGQLSGGQRQRVALARALVRRPRLFLLDEPLSNLDVALRTETRTEIVDLQKRLGATTVYVTHDQGEAMTMASRIAVMMDGTVAQLGTPQEIYRRPADIRVARFMGSPAMTLLDGVVRRGALHLAGDSVTGGEAPLAGVSGIADGPVSIGIRAEHLRIASDGAAAPIRATVRHLEFLGSEVIAHLTADGLAGSPRMVARLDPQAGSGFAPGAAVGVWPDPLELHLFDRDGRRSDAVLSAARTLSVAS